MNPLLDFSGLPRYAEIKPEHVTSATEELLKRNRTLMAKLLADPAAPTWDKFVQPFEDANEHLARAWGQVGHLNAVMNSTELREVYNANLPKITQYYAELSQNLALFQKYKAIRNSANYATLNPEQQKVIENELRDFRLGGAELPEDKKARFMVIQEKLSALTSKFSDNLLDATNAFTCVVEDEISISGIPADECQVAAEAAQQAGKKGWLFTLKAPSYGPVMQYADNRDLRERMYRAYTTRASEQATADNKADLNNTQLMSEILKLRAEEARMLGFANYAELSLASKMADSPQQVKEFLLELAQRARPFAEKDLEELRAFAAAQLGLENPSAELRTGLQAWDIGYVSEKLRQQRYAFSEQEVKQYFPEDAVLSGLFGLVETLFGLRIKPSSAPAWHEDVRFFDIRDDKDLLIGQFYIDLYARASKRGGAWMDDAITRRRTAKGIQIPVAYLNCNFASPLGGKPALFTHDEVITLFHEFGHGLHHLLTEVEELGVSGINGVEWDAVELPSQFMENFCWEWDVLQGMTRHSETGKKLPRDLYDKMIAAKNFQSGLQMLRQIEFSLFDLRLHSDYDAEGTQSVQELLDEVRKEVAVLIPPSFNRFQNSFSHIFAGGYAAGYYSYKWAEVLSADAYSLFEENGILNTATGSHFREQVLAVGGSRDAMDSFIAFRGREPKIDALLRHNGLVEA
ncbi:MAG: M3 family metallopeptidase [Gammaproteobacteria bacterium]|nr:M3 family metallopeptidase [Gammaproteobacteria bacterium]MBU1482459.1 M3 family metallopeptidase [Gammaproteobacteria bacterium]